MSTAAQPLCPLQPLDALDSETFPGIDERLHLILPVFFAKVGLPKLVHKTEMDNGWIRESLGRAPYRWEWKGVQIYIRSSRFGWSVSRLEGWKGGRLAGRADSPVDGIR